MPQTDRMPLAKSRSGPLYNQGQNHLATIDYMSNFIKVDHLYSTTISAVRAKLQAHVARYGIPDTLVMDNGPLFSSIEFATFAKQCNFLHKTSSPRHPASNGMAESGVKDSEAHLNEVCGR